MSLDLKLASEKDFEKIAEIYSEELSKEFNEPWTKKKALKKAKIFSKYCDIWRIDFDGKIVGFVIVNSNQWYPGEVIFGEEMAIRKEFQGKGIAPNSLDKLFDFYSKKGYKKYYGIVIKGSKSFNLHKKIGANLSKEQLIMEKSLE